MALGTNHVTLTEATASARDRSNSAFVRELWTDEIIANYKANLVMAPLVVNMPFTGKKGDTVHIPNPTRGSASSKSSETEVTLIANQESQKQFIIDQHYEYSRLIEDIVATQADDSLRSFYTDDAGYALAKQIDTDLWTEAALFSGNTSSPTTEASSAYDDAVVGTPSSGSLVDWDPSANTSEGNASTLNDEGIRLLIQQLDENDVPSMGRVLLVPPVEKTNLLGISRFTEQAFVGETGAANQIRNGLIANLYGVEVYVSTNSPVVQDSGTNGNERAATIFQKEGLVFIEQMRPRVQSMYYQNWLGDLLTADTIYGTGVLRPEAGISVVVPA